NLDLGSGTGGKQHQPHDGQRRDGYAICADRYSGCVLLCQLGHARGGPGMKAALIDDGHGAADDTVAAFGLRRGTRFPCHVGDYPARSASNCDATFMYLRPASWASVTALARSCVFRTRASWIIMGRLTPAMTSTPVSFITEIDRLEGVPPNMSVSRMTPPSPRTFSIAVRISRRRCSISSSGRMQTVATFSCG